MRLGWLSLVVAAVLALMPTACSPAATAGPSLTVDCAAFGTEGVGGAVIQRELELTIGETFEVTLCSDPSTGSSWEQPTWDGDAGIEFVSRAVLRMVGGAPGQAGQERFTFRTRAAGRSTIHFVYSQPWEGGQKGAWRVDLGLSVTPPGD